MLTLYTWLSTVYFHHDEIQIIVHPISYLKLFPFVSESVLWGVGAGEANVGGLSSPAQFKKENKTELFKY